MISLLQCSIAKVGFEKNKVSEGFEALARAQYLLKSNVSLAKMPLLSQVCIFPLSDSVYGIDMKMTDHLEHFLGRRIFGGPCTCLHVGTSGFASYS